MTAALFIGIITILHLIGYAIFIYLTIHTKAGNAQKGEIIEHKWDETLQEINNPLPSWWLIMFYIMLFCGIAYLIFYPGVFGDKFKGALGWSQIEQYEKVKNREEARANEYFSAYEKKSVEELAKDSNAIASGRRIFLQNCAVCHAQNAKGAALGYPDLTDKDWLWGDDTESLIYSITEGRNTIQGQGMPQGGALIADVNKMTSEDNQKLEAVANYVLTLSGKKANNENLVAQGKELYEQSCVACHLADGKGMKALGAPDLSDNIWLYSRDANINDIKAQILKPTNNMMPSWKQWLSPAKIKVVAAYVYSLSHK